MVRFRLSIETKRGFETKQGTGVIVRTGETLDGYCDAGAYIVRVVESPDYAPGTLVQCSLVYQVTP